MTISKTIFVRWKFGFVAKAAKTDSLWIAFDATFPSRNLFAFYVAFTLFAWWIIPQYISYTMHWTIHKKRCDTLTYCSQCMLKCFFSLAWAFLHRVTIDVTCISCSTFSSRVQSIPRKILKRFLCTLSLSPNQSLPLASCLSLQGMRASIMIYWIMLGFLFAVGVQQKCD